jgi:hypothetical protein
LAAPGTTTMLSPMSRIGILLRTVIAVGALITALASPAAAAATSEPAEPTAAGSTQACFVSGYVCIEHSLGWTLVYEGQRADFPGGLATTSITNMTQVTYCGRGDFFFGIGSGQSVSAPRVVYALWPSYGGYCLL